MQCPRDLRKLIVGWFTNADLYMVILAHGMHSTAEWYSGQQARKCIELFTETKCPQVWLWRHGSSEQINYMLLDIHGMYQSVQSQCIHASLRTGRVDLLPQWLNWNFRLRPVDLIPACRSMNPSMVWYVLTSVWGHSTACTPTQKCHECRTEEANYIDYNDVIFHAWNEVVASDNIQCAEILATIRTHYTEHHMFNQLLKRVMARSKLAIWLLARIPLTQWARGHIIQRDPAFADILQKYQSDLIFHLLCIFTTT
jgi:hypothetical protein